MLVQNECEFVLLPRPLLWQSVKLPLEGPSTISDLWFLSNWLSYRYSFLKKVIDRFIMRSSEQPINQST